MAGRAQLLPFSKVPYERSTPSSKEMTRGELREIAALIARLLSHYWTAADPIETRQAQHEDWLMDLREFGPEIVEQACLRWRRQPDGRRPTPGQIRALCIQEQNEHRNVHALTPRANIQLVSDDEWRRRLEAHNKAGGNDRSWPQLYGLPPTHPASRVPKALRKEFGFAS